MVTNSNKGDVYLRDARFLINGDVAMYFLVESADKITTRFGSRDRILRGYRCKAVEGKLIKLEKGSYWCSELLDTNSYKKAIK